MHCTTLPNHSSFSQKILVSFAMEINTASINFLIPMTNGNPSSVDIRQHCGREQASTSGNPVKEILLKLNLPDHRFRRRCYNLIPAESNS
ncbi:hypothetical protein Tco_0905588 [Tanacetum coccineum]